MSAPAVEKDAGAEALFWTVHVVDEYRENYADRALYPERALYHYVRLKLFDEKGKEKFSTIDIEFGPKIGIEGVAARTIKPDGSVVEMKSNAVYERDLVRAGGRKVRVKSFALPESSRERLSSIVTKRLARIIMSPMRGFNCNGSIPCRRSLTM